MRDPTPQEIEERCREIQREWTPEERFSRMRADWRPTFTTADGRNLTMDVEDYTEHHEQRASILATTNHTSQQKPGAFPMDGGSIKQSPRHGAREFRSMAAVQNQVIDNGVRNGADLEIPQVPGCEINAAIVAFNVKVQANTTAIMDNRHGMPTFESSEVEKATLAGTVAELKQRRDAFEAAVEPLLFARNALGAEGLAIIGRIGASIEAAVGKAREDVEQARAEVRQGLASIGVTAESDPRHAVNAEQAARSFEARVDGSPLVAEKLTELERLQALPSHVGLADLQQRYPRHVEKLQNEHTDFVAASALT